jgi:hypothetical protein
MGVEQGGHSGPEPGELDRQDRIIPLEVGGGENLITSTLIGLIDEKTQNQPEQWEDFYAADVGLEMNALRNKLRMEDGRLAYIFRPENNDTNISHAIFLLDYQDNNPTPYSITKEYFIFKDGQIKENVMGEDDKTLRIKELLGFADEVASDDDQSKEDEIGALLAAQDLEQAVNEEKQSKGVTDYWLDPNSSQPRAHPLEKSFAEVSEPEVDELIKQFEHAEAEDDIGEED